jgi:phage terminase small subunit
MGSGRGRPRKPTALKVAKGTYRADRSGDPAEEPNFGTLSIAPPAPVCLGDAGKAKWDWLVPQLISAGIFQNVDTDALETLCQCHDEIAICNEDIAHAKKIRDDRRLQISLVERRFWLDRKARHEREFGLTPSSRSSVKVKPPEKQGLLARKRG